MKPWRTCVFLYLTRSLCISDFHYVYFKPTEGSFLQHVKSLSKICETAEWKRSSSLLSSPLIDSAWQTVTYLGNRSVSINTQRNKRYFRPELIVYLNLSVFTPPCPKLFPRWVNTCPETQGGEAPKLLPAMGTSCKEIASCTTEGYITTGNSTGPL